MRRLIDETKKMLKEIFISYVLNNNISSSLSF